MNKPVLSLKPEAKRQRQERRHSVTDLKVASKPEPEPAPKTEPKKPDPTQDKRYVEKLRKKRFKVARKWLASTWPEVFDTEAPKPLAIGEGPKIRAARPEHISNNDLRHAVRWYLTSKPYREALAVGGHRYNLAGEPAGEISESHQAHAAKSLK